jgi:hypothetical protein
MHAKMPCEGPHKFEVNFSQRLENTVAIGDLGSRGMAFASFAGVGSFQSLLGLDALRVSANGSGPCKTSCTDPIRGFVSANGPSLGNGSQAAVNCHALFPVTD